MGLISWSVYNPRVENLDSVLTVWQQEVNSNTKYDGNDTFRQD